MFLIIRQLKWVESLLDKLLPVFIPIFYYVNKTALSCGMFVWVSELCILVCSNNECKFEPSIC